QEIAPNANTNKSGASFTFKASIEQPATKATINSSNQLVWAENDQIGIYVNDGTWTDKNQPFTLVGTGGATQGDFAWDYGTFDNPNATAAFFPWEGTGSDKNNVFNENAYFKLRDSYWSYTSGKMLTPLVANITRTGDAYDRIAFKHAGAAVKVTINNLPARVHSIGMSVEGQQISGDYSINPANAGTDALALVGTADATKNSVWLNIWNGSESKWEFIFPVPELTRPKLSFQIYDENDILVWSKKLKAQSSDLKRAEILVMPEIDIAPYSQFKESTEWTFCGTIGGINAWDADIPMYTDDNVCILSGITFAANDEFKIRKGKTWGEAYPSSNYVVSAAGTYDVFFNISTKEITLKEAKCPYPAPKVTLYFGINTAGGKGIAISSSTLAPGYSWPGLTLTEREYINNKWYYKHVVDGPTIWGKTVSASIVGIDQWNTKNTTLIFDTIKTEYYFEATSGVDIEQLSDRPADSGSSSASITIGGGFTDWASVEGVTSGNNTVKVASDDTNIYVYFSRTSASGDYTAMWNGGGYVYVSFDLDNDASTGSGDIYGNKSECIALLYPFSTPYSFYTTPQSNWQCSPSPYTIANVSLYGEGDATAATAEMCFPRADLPTIPSSDPITIKVWGNKGMSTVSLLRKL
ncbi:MAG: hypothetical protein K6A64_10190, partial [Bacteroidales bacterium]|nr:hypothetical protein [Bacteroidales bacterium]